MQSVLSLIILSLLIALAYGQNFTCVDEGVAGDSDLMECDDAFKVRIQNL